MKRPIRLLLFVSTLLFFACNLSDNSEKTTFKPISVRYPLTPRDTTVVDTFYGKRILDPFRWLENSYLPATREWIIQQQALTEKYVNQIPNRANIRAHLESLWSQATYANPIRKGNFFYVLKNEKLQPQPILYQFRNLQDTIGKTILNLNTPSSSGARILEEFAFSQDGSLLAYEVAENGTRWNSIFVKDMESNKTLLDTLKWVQFSTIAWYRDGFFYSRYPQEQTELYTAPYEFQQIYYHRVGEPQENDELIFADRSNPQVNFTAQTTSDERFLILYAHQHQHGNALYVRDLQNETLDFIPILEDFDATFKVIDNIGNNLLIYTNYKAPNYRLVQINVQRPEERFWENIISETGAVLQTVRLYGGKLVATYTSNESNVLKIFDLRGKLQREVPVPGDGFMGDWSGNAREEQAFFTFHPFAKAPLVYTLNVNNFSTAIYKPASTDAGNNSYDIQQIRYKTYDGTTVPMTILSKKNIPLDAARPTLLLSECIDFTMVQTILEVNGICAIAEVRGTDGRGENWRRAGIKTNKQNAFDDFQAAAEYLIANNYTNPSKLAIYGVGAGALVVGASITQRPDLFRVALLDGGILDILRYDRFTNGWIWRGDFGTISKPDEFDALVAYSPVHQVVPANYPATMILTSNRNNQVVPVHSYKFAAELQQRQQGTQPVLLRVAQGDAHPLLPEKINKTTDILTFLLYHIQAHQDH